MRRPPPPHPRGTPRTPGSGRKAGTLNKRTVAMRELMTSLCDDVDYQYKLREDFRRRRVHPTVETLVWSHVVGKPTEKVQLTANVSMNHKLDEELELFRQLSVPQLEELAADSEALLAKARAMARRQLPPARATLPTAPLQNGASGNEPTEKSTDVGDA